MTHAGLEEALSAHRATLDRIAQYDQEAAECAAIGNQDSAWKFLAKSLQLRIDQLGAKHASLPGAAEATAQACGHSVGLMLRNGGDFAAAEKSLQSTLELIREVHRSCERANLAPCLNALLGSFAALYQHMGEHQAAIVYLKEASSLCNAVPYSHAAATQMNLCAQLSRSGCHEEAEVCAVEAVRLAEADVLGMRPTSELAGGKVHAANVGEKVSTLAVAYNNLAVQREHLGFVGQQAALYEKAVVLAEVYMEPDSTILARLREAHSNASHIDGQRNTDRNPLVARQRPNLAGPFRRHGSGVSRQSHRLPTLDPDSIHFSARHGAVSHQQRGAECRRRHAYSTSALAIAIQQMQMQSEAHLPTSKSLERSKSSRGGDLGRNKRQRHPHLASPSSKQNLHGGLRGLDKKDTCDEKRISNTTAHVIPSPRPGSDASTEYTVEWVSPVEPVQRHGQLCPRTAPADELKSPGTSTVEDCEASEKRPAVSAQSHRMSGPRKSLMEARREAVILEMQNDDEGNHLSAQPQCTIPDVDTSGQGESLHERSCREATLHLQGDGVASTAAQLRSTSIPDESSVQGEPSFGKPHCESALQKQADPVSRPDAQSRSRCTNSGADTPDQREPLYGMSCGDVPRLGGPLVGKENGQEPEAECPPELLPSAPEKSLEVPLVSSSGSCHSPTSDAQKSPQPRLCRVPQTKMSGSMPLLGLPALSGGVEGATRARTMSQRSAVPPSANTDSDRSFDMSEPHAQPSSGRDVPTAVQVESFSDAMKPATATFGDQLCLPSSKSSAEADASTRPSDITLSKQPVHQISSEADSLDAVGDPPPLAASIVVLPPVCIESPVNSSSSRESPAKSEIERTDATMSKHTQSPRSIHLHSAVAEEAVVLSASPPAEQSNADDDWSNIGKPVSEEPDTTAQFLEDHPAEQSHPSAGRPGHIDPIQEGSNEGAAHAETIVFPMDSHSAEQSVRGLDLSTQVVDGHSPVADATTSPENALSAVHTNSLVDGSIASGPREVLDLQSAVATGDPSDAHLAEHSIQPVDELIAADTRAGADSQSSVVHVDAPACLVEARPATQVSGAADWLDTKELTSEVVDSQSSLTDTTGQLLGPHSSEQSNPIACWSTSTEPPHQVVNGQSSCAEATVHPLNTNSILQANPAVGSSSAVEQKREVVVGEASVADTAVQPMHAHVAEQSKAEACWIISPQPSSEAEAEPEPHREPPQDVFAHSTVEQDEDAYLRFSAQETKDDVDMASGTAEAVEGEALNFSSCSGSPNRILPSELLHEHGEDSTPSEGQVPVAEYQLQEALPLSASELQPADNLDSVDSQRLGSTCVSGPVTSMHQFNLAEQPEENVQPWSPKDSASRRPWWIQLELAIDPKSQMPIAEATEVQWQCANCSFLNEVSPAVCVLCDAERFAVIT